MELFACVHTWMLFKYGCRRVFAVSKFLCVVEPVMICDELCVFGRWIRFV